jgi:hypothetical protein
MAIPNTELGYTNAMSTSGGEGLSVNFEAYAEKLNQFLDNEK